jgi:hypothetical protein
VPKGHKESCCLEPLANLGTCKQDSSWVNIFLKRYQAVLIEMILEIELSWKSVLLPTLNATKQEGAIVILLNRFFGAADRGLWTFFAWKCCVPSWCRDYVPKAEPSLRFLELQTPGKCLDFKRVLISIRDDFLGFSSQAFLSAERVVPISNELREQRLSHRV